MRCVPRLIEDRGRRPQLAKRSTVVALPAARLLRGRSGWLRRSGGSARLPALPPLAPVRATPLDCLAARRESFAAVVGTQPLRWRRPGAPLPAPANTWREGYPG